MMRHMDYMQKLFRRPPKAPSTGKGHRIYAIGDIHGRYDLFCKIIEQIITHWEQSERDFKAVRVILLGDIIDRGPDSREALELAYKLVTKSRVRLLRGNHEDLLLKSMEGHAIAQDIWMENGGEAFLDSFGLAPRGQGEDSFDFGERIAAAIPEKWAAMLRETALMYRSGDYVFVHAGVRPGVPLHKQDEQDLLFIRGEFTASKRWHDAVIVHGHTIVDDVEMLSNRIAIDTGAYASDRLTAICLQDSHYEVLHT